MQVVKIIKRPSTHKSIQLILSAAQSLWVVMRSVVASVQASVKLKPQGNHHYPLLSTV